ncbi:hypothetical protein N0V85_005356 [Neurospora sp. IMI 360204]|nr:hypothetical protein N0V85_005356 [Neurospora sp. IMI 360204]
MTETGGKDSVTALDGIPAFIPVTASQLACVLYLKDSHSQSLLKITIGDVTKVTGNSEDSDEVTISLKLPKFPYRPKSQVPTIWTVATDL